MDVGQRIRKRYGGELSQSPDDLPTEQKDVWTFFDRGAGGLMAWHHKCEKHSEGTAEYELPISSASNNTTMRCTIADMLTPFTALRIRKPFTMNSGVESGALGQPATDGGNVHSTLVQPDLVPDVWDEQVWQSILEDFSMFPTQDPFLLDPAGNPSPGRFR
jgi:hypothetical protein